MYAAANELPWPYRAIFSVVKPELQTVAKFIKSNDRKTGKAPVAVKDALETILNTVNIFLKSQSEIETVVASRSDTATILARSFKDNGTLPFRLVANESLGTVTTDTSCARLTHATLALFSAIGIPRDRYGAAVVTDQKTVAHVFPVLFLSGGKALAADPSVQPVRWGAPLTYPSRSFSRQLTIISKFSRLAGFSGLIRPKATILVRGDPTEEMGFENSAKALDLLDKKGEGFSLEYARNVLKHRDIALAHMLLLDDHLSAAADAEKRDEAKTASLHYRQAAEHAEKVLSSPFLGFNARLRSKKDFDRQSKSIVLSLEKCGFRSSAKHARKVLTELQANARVKPSRGSHTPVVL
jgi:hypothetical protein